MLKRPLLLLVFLAVLILTLVWVRPAGATHDTIYSPCSGEYGYIHMTYDEWAAHITTLEADGTIPPGVVFRYYEALHGGKGNTVLEDGTIPAWDNWAGGLEDGMILSIADWLNGDYPEIEELMFSSGKVPEWILDANRVIRRVDDPYWGVPNPMTPTFTVWQSLCMGDYGYSIPVMEINEDGVWVSNLPTTTTITIPPTTTTTSVPASEAVADATELGETPDPSMDSEPPEQEQDEFTPTTTQVPLPDPGPEPSIEEPEIGPSVGLPDGYDLWDAQYDGWPFMETIILLEERYPQGTPGKYHFRLSTAVEFLRQGGMVGGLDRLWDTE